MSISNSFRQSKGTVGLLDASMQTELVEKRREGRSEKRSNSRVERKRREKILDGLPIETRLYGMVEVDLRVVLDVFLCRRPESREDYGHLYCGRIYMMLKRRLFSRDSFRGTIFEERKKRRKKKKGGKGGGVVCECFECCSKESRNSCPATKMVA